MAVTVLPDGSCDGAPGLVLRPSDLAVPPQEGQAVVMACLPVRPGASSACVLGVRVQPSLHSTPLHSTPSRLLPPPLLSQALRTSLTAVCVVSTPWP